MANPLKKISLKRDITSYGKVQSFISSIIRGKEAFVSKKNIQKHKLLYLNHTLIFTIFI